MQKYACLLCVVLLSLASNVHGQGCCAVTTQITQPTDSSGQAFPFNTLHSIGIKVKKVVFTDGVADATACGPALTTNFHDGESCNTISLCDACLPNELMFWSGLAPDQFVRGCWDTSSSVGGYESVRTNFFLVFASETQQFISTLNTNGLAHPASMGSPFEALFISTSTRTAQAPIGECAKTPISGIMGPTAFDVATINNMLGWLAQSNPGQEQHCFICDDLGFVDEAAMVAAFVFPGVVIDTAICNVCPVVNPPPPPAPPLVTGSPTTSPTSNPTVVPTTNPTNAPTTSPTLAPTISPSSTPTGSPTTTPLGCCTVSVITNTISPDFTVTYSSTPSGCLGVFGGSTSHVLTTCPSDACMFCGFTKIRVYLDSPPFPILPTDTRFCLDTFQLYGESQANIETAYSSSPLAPFQVAVGVFGTCQAYTPVTPLSPIDFYTVVASIDPSQSSISTLPGLICANCDAFGDPAGACECPRPPTGSPTASPSGSPTRSPTRSPSTSPSPAPTQVPGLCTRTRLFTKAGSDAVVTRFVYNVEPESTCTMSAFETASWVTGIGAGRDLCDVCQGGFTEVMDLPSDLSVRWCLHTANFFGKTTAELEQIYLDLGSNPFRITPFQVATTDGVSCGISTSINSGVTFAAFINARSVQSFGYCMKCSASEYANYILEGDGQPEPVACGCPVTPAPTMSPTMSPTPPTLAPTPAPTTLAPTPSPTPAPTPSPTFGPVCCVGRFRIGSVVVFFYNDRNVGECQITEIPEVGACADLKIRGYCNPEDLAFKFAPGATDRSGCIIEYARFTFDVQAEAAMFADLASPLFQPFQTGPSGVVVYLPIGSPTAGCSYIVLDSVFPRVEQPIGYCANCAGPATPNFCDPILGCCYEKYSTFIIEQSGRRNGEYFDYNSAPTLSIDCRTQMAMSISEPTRFWSEHSCTSTAGRNLRHSLCAQDTDGFSTGPNGVGTSTLGTIKRRRCYRKAILLDAIAFFDDGFLNGRQTLHNIWRNGNMFIQNEPENGILSQTRQNPVTFRKRRQGPTGTFLCDITKLRSGATLLPFMSNAIPIIADEDGRVDCIRCDITDRLSTRTAPVLCDPRNTACVNFASSGIAFISILSVSQCPSADLAQDVPVAPVEFGVLTKMCDINPDNTMMSVEADTDGFITSRRRWEIPAFDTYVAMNGYAALATAILATGQGNGFYAIIHQGVCSLAELRITAEGLEQFRTDTSKCKNCDNPDFTGIDAIEGIPVDGGCNCDPNTPAPTPGPLQCHGNGDFAPLKPKKQKEGEKTDKTTICHISNKKAETISVSAKGLKGHFKEGEKNHGKDRVQPCCKCRNGFDPTTYCERCPAPPKEILEFACRDGERIEICKPTKPSPPCDPEKQKEGKTPCNPEKNKEDNKKGEKSKKSEKQGEKQKEGEENNCVERLSSDTDPGFDGLGCTCQPLIVPTPSPTPAPLLPTPAPTPSEATATTAGPPSSSGNNAIGGNLNSAVSGASEKGLSAGSGAAIGLTIFFVVGVIVVVSIMIMRRKRGARSIDDGTFDGVDTAVDPNGDSVLTDVISDVGFSDLATDEHDGMEDFNEIELSAIQSNPAFNAELVDDVIKGTDYNENEHGVLTGFDTGDETSALDSGDSSGLIFGLNQGPVSEQPRMPTLEE